jgi:Hemerythrin HHE cation binding domain
VPGDDRQRALAFSRQLRQVHDQLQEQLTGLRTEPGQSETSDLLRHCLAFCSALSEHHSAEDGGLFGALLAARPDLAPAIGKLTGDHAAIAAILGRVRVLTAQARTAPAEDLAALRRELDGLAAIAQSHFRYEERALSAALDDAAPAAGWPPAAFGSVDYQ